MKVFLYDNRFELGIGLFASAKGYKLVSAGLSETPEAVTNNGSMIYGYIHEVDQDVLDMMDTYYGLGVKLHERIEIDAVLAGGVKVKAQMYEFNMEIA